MRTYKDGYTESHDLEALNTPTLKEVQDFLDRRADEHIGRERWVYELAARCVGDCILLDQRRRMAR